MTSNHDSIPPGLRGASIHASPVAGDDASPATSFPDGVLKRRAWAQRMNIAGADYWAINLAERRRFLWILGIWEHAVYYTIDHDRADEIVNTFLQTGEMPDREIS